jgi:Cu(I)/Ag(I) efflux system membrane protein CusA/SilA
MRKPGVFMLLYLDLAYDQAKREGRLRNLQEPQEAILQGAVKRLRPKFMTMAAAFLGLIPIMWATGAGSDVMKRIAAPCFSRQNRTIFQQVRV